MFSRESVFGLLAADEVEKKPRPLRKSIHSGLCAPSYSTFGLKGTSKPGVQNVGGSTEAPPGSNHVFVKSGAMLGPPLGTLKADAKRFTLKHSKTHRVPTLRELRQSAPHLLHTSTRPKQKLKADLPKASDKPVFGLQSDINYVRYNAAINILSRPPRVPKEVNFLKKEGYGEVPAYLQDVKKQVQKEYEFITSLRKTQDNSEGEQLQLMPEEERKQLLAELRAAWDKLNHGYQEMTYKSKMESIGQARRKEYFEKSLAEIESHIEKLEAGQVWVATK